jgi:endoglucanase
MRKIINLCLCCVCLAACSGQAKSTSTPAATPPPPTSTLVPTATPMPLPTPAPSPTLPPAAIFERNNRIGRAVNLGNALEAPNEGEWGVKLKEEYFPLIKNAGFTAVRIPVRFSNHAEADTPYTIDNTFLQRVDWAVNKALEQGLVAILDMHHYVEIFEKPLDHKERFLAIWAQLAEHYQDYSPDLYFELLNEPNGQLTSDLWSQFAAEAVDIVRQTNPTRPIIIGPGEWNSAAQLQFFTPPDDQNIIITFHYYSPFHFTHQGADWAEGSEAWLGTKWSGSSTERMIMRQDFSLAAEWGVRNGRPLFLGEFGAFNEADMDSRALWTATVARTAEELGISWAYWEFCSSFGVYDPVANQWREPLLEALIHPHSR